MFFHDKPVLVVFWVKLLQIQIMLCSSVGMINPSVEKVVFFFYGCQWRSFQSDERHGYESKEAICDSDPYAA